MKIYCIKNKLDNELYWSNDFGYVEENFTLFRENEVNELNLPI